MKYTAKVSHFLEPKELPQNEDSTVIESSEDLPRDHPIKTEVCGEEPKP